MSRGFDSGFSEPIVEKSVSRANRLGNRNAVPLTGVGKSVRLAVAAARKEKLPPEEAVKAAAFVLLRYGGLLSAAAENSVPQNRIGRLYRDWISPLSEAQLRFAAALSEIAISQEGDFLGLLYRSLLTVGDCAKNGLYYTPPQAAAAVSLHPGETVCDPCCGSGSLLIAVLPPGTESSAVFAFDIDETALRLCEVNLALFFKDGDFRSRLEIRDAIAEDGDSPLRFDVIVANPPWGARVHRHSEDSFALILRRSLDRLKEGGRWFFILPESFLTVRRHSRIRREAVNRCKKISVRPLGNAFPGVLSEAFWVEGRVKTKADGQSAAVCVIPDGGVPFAVAPPQPPDFAWEVHAAPQDREMIRRLYTPGWRSVGEICGFALGIVTGGDGRLTAEAPFDGGEPVFRGRDVRPFLFGKPSRWMRFDPKKIRQCVKEEVYRLPKIVYRFIGERFCCLYDESGALILNSANALIPKDESYPVSAMVCLFNSVFLNFILRKRFHSRKILRSHIETLPLPMLSPELKNEFENLHRQIVGEGGLTDETERRLQTLAAAAFGLPSEAVESYRIR